MRVTERLVLRPFTHEIAERIVSDSREADWVVDYPTRGDRVIAGHVLQAAGPLVGPWVPYQLVRRSDGLVVGGAGFHSVPSSEGTVEIGYGVAVSAQRCGYATEAARCLVEWARELGAKRVVARTDASNAGSRRVLEAAGLVLVTAVEDVEDGCFYRLEL